jgi:hypothetical protein
MAEPRRMQPAADPRDSDRRRRMNTAERRRQASRQEPRKPPQNLRPGDDDGRANWEKWATITPAVL